MTNYIITQAEVGMDKIFTLYALTKEVVIKAIETLQKMFRAHRFLLKSHVISSHT